MLGITKESRTEKTKRTTQDVVSYLQEIVRDERLRAHLRAAIDHGAEGEPSGEEGDRGRRYEHTPCDR